MQNVHNCDMQINEPKDLQFFNEIRIINNNVMFNMGFWRMLNLIEITPVKWSKGQASARESEDLWFGFHNQGCGCALAKVP